MTMTFNPNATANKNPESFNPVAQFEALKFDTAVPEAVRAFAETAVTQTREAYERSKATLEAGLEAMERSYDAAGHATAALNRKIIDIAQRNINSSFDLAKSLAGAKTLAEMVELQGAYWRKQFEMLMTQAEEVRALSINATADVAETIRRHAAHQAEQVQALSKRVTADAARAVKCQVAQFDDELRKAG
ncbi:MAG: phasin family protein [Methyloceanibacter sp.]